MTTIYSVILETKYAFPPPHPSHAHSLARSHTISHSPFRIGNQYAHTISVSMDKRETPDVQNVYEVKSWVIDRNLIFLKLLEKKKKKQRLRSYAFSFVSLQNIE